MNEWFRGLFLTTSTICVYWLIVNGAMAQTPALNLKYTGFQLPVDITHNEIDPGLYVAELGGAIKYIPDLDKDSAIVIGIIPEVRDTAESGLFGITFHPEFPDSPYIYVHYTHDTSYFETRLSRFTMNGKVLDTLSERIIISIDNLSWFHQGGNPMFGADGYIYLPKGDGDLNDAPKINGQDPSTLKGAILRLDIDSDGFPEDSFKNYAIPADNPFVDSTEILDEIFAFGFRNPWRISQDLATQNIYVGEVGWNLYEEVNLLHSGGNYGWSCYEGPFIHTDQPCFGDMGSLVAPLFWHAHGEFSSLTGGFVYRGQKYSKWQGVYFFADFTERMLCFRKEDKSHCWDNSNSSINTSIVTMGQDINHELYVADLYTGDIFRVDTTTIRCLTPPDTVEISVLNQSIYEAASTIILKTDVDRDLFLYAPEIILEESVQVHRENTFKSVVDKDLCGLRTSGFVYDE